MVEVTGGTNAARVADQLCAAYPDADCCLLEVRGGAAADAVPAASGDGNADSAAPKGIPAICGYIDVRATSGVCLMDLIGQVVADPASASLTLVPVAGFVDTISEQVMVGRTMRLAALRGSDEYLQDLRQLGDLILRALGVDATFYDLMGLPSRFTAAAALSGPQPDDHPDESDDEHAGSVGPGSASCSVVDGTVISDGSTWGAVVTRRAKHIVESAALRGLCGAVGALNRDQMGQLRYDDTIVCATIAHVVMGLCTGPCGVDVDGAILYWREHLMPCAQPLVVAFVSNVYDVVVEDGGLGIDTRLVGGRDRLKVVTTARTLMGATCCILRGPLAESFEWLRIVDALHPEDEQDEEQPDMAADGTHVNGNGTPGSSRRPIKQSVLEMLESDMSGIGRVLSAQCGEWRLTMDTFPDGLVLVAPIVIQAVLAGRMLMCERIGDLAIICRFFTHLIVSGWDHVHDVRKAWDEMQHGEGGTWDSDVTAHANGTATPPPSCGSPSSHRDGREDGPPLSPVPSVYPLSQSQSNAVDRIWAQIWRPVPFPLLNFIGIPIREAERQRGRLEGSHLDRVSTKHWKSHPLCGWMEYSLHRLSMSDPVFGGPWRRPPNTQRVEGVTDGARKQSTQDGDAATVAVRQRKSMLMWSVCDIPYVRLAAVALALSTNDGLGRPFDAAGYDGQTSRTFVRYAAMISASEVSSLEAALLRLGYGTLSSVESCGLGAFVIDFFVRVSREERTMHRQGRSQTTIGSAERGDLKLNLARGLVQMLIPRRSELMAQLALRSQLEEAVVSTRVWRCAEQEVPDPFILVERKQDTPVAAAEGAASSVAASCNRNEPSTRQHVG